MPHALVSELVYEPHLKCGARKGLRVQIPPRAVLYKQFALLDCREAVKMFSFSRAGGIRRLVKPEAAQNCSGDRSCPWPVDLVFCGDVGCEDVRVSVFHNVADEPTEYGLSILHVGPGFAPEDA